MRAKRVAILQAFDIYKSNLYYEIIIETEDEHTKIVEWYQKLLGLDEDAINNIPDKVKKYL